VPAYGANLLLAGPSGAGKSTPAAGLLERLAEQDYQVLVLDPEGDHEDFEDAVDAGDRHDPPSIDQLLAALQEPGQRVVANLPGRRLEDLPAYLNQLLRRLRGVAYPHRSTPMS
jgi:NaMN:DMB phosphoribosyltransferase